MSKLFSAVIFTVLVSFNNAYASASSVVVHNGFSIEVLTVEDGASLDDLMGGYNNPICYIGDWEEACGIVDLIVENENSWSFADQSIEACNVSESSEDISLLIKAREYSVSVGEFSVLKSFGFNLPHCSQL